MKEEVTSIEKFAFMQNKLCSLRFEDLRVLKKYLNELWFLTRKVKKVYKSHINNTKSNNNA